MTSAALQDAFFPGNRCFGCGPSNPHGFHLKSYEGVDGVFTAEWTAETTYEGPPGVVNGGVLAIPMDCHSTWTAIHAFSERSQGEARGAVTASYDVRLRRPTPTGRRIDLRAWVESIDGRRAVVRCEASVDGTVTAEFVGTFVEVEMWDQDQD